MRTAREKSSWLTEWTWIELNSIRTQYPVLQFSSECKFIQIRSVPDALLKYPPVTMANVDILHTFVGEGKGT